MNLKRFISIIKRDLATLEGKDSKVNDAIIYFYSNLLKSENNQFEIEYRLGKDLLEFSCNQCMKTEKVEK